MEAASSENASVGRGIGAWDNGILEASTLHLRDETAQFASRHIFVAANHDLGTLVVIRRRTDCAIQPRSLNRRAVQRQRQVGFKIEIKPPFTGYILRRLPEPHRNSERYPRSADPLGGGGNGWPRLMIARASASNAGMFELSAISLATKFPARSMRNDILTNPSRHWPRAGKVVFRVIRSTICLRQSSSWVAGPSFAVAARGATLFGSAASAGAFGAAARWLAAIDEQRTMAAENPWLQRGRCVALVFMRHFPDQMRGPPYSEFHRSPNKGPALNVGRRRSNRSGLFAVC
jgi:hypothetical protein